MYQSALEISNLLFWSRSILRHTQKICVLLGTQYINNLSHTPNVLCKGNRTP